MKRSKSYFLRAPSTFGLPLTSARDAVKWINKAIKISFLVGQMDANLNLVIVLLGVSRM